jgi:RNA polymerase sigma-70 factor (ECF subfamily)
MAKVTEAEQYLLDGVRRGDDRAWSQLVDRYQGRLMTFAKARVPQSADSEDLVQETFISFIKGLPQFRQDCNLETYLFSLLRRKIIDTYRRRGASHVCLLQDVSDGSRDDESPDVLEQRACADPSVSGNARRDERVELQRQALAGALGQLVEGLKQSLDFAALKTVELLFYAQRPNGQVAQILGISSNQVGVFKHRSLKQIRQWVVGSGVQDVFPPDDESLGGAAGDLLTEVWQSQRLSCPKRMTIGGFVLGTLDPDWRAYVDFHLHTLGCHFCRANLEDLKPRPEEEVSPVLRARIMESTVGFLRKP